VEHLITNQTFLDALEEARTNRKPWYGKNATPEINSFFKISDFEQLINQKDIWNANNLKVMRDHQYIPTGELFTSLETISGIKQQLSLTQLREALNHGCSVILNDICNISSGAMEIRETLAEWAKGKIDCNLYFSQKDHQAFPIHYDVHDVFAFQIEGKKRWQIFEQKTKYPINHPVFQTRVLTEKDSFEKTPILDVYLKPGDLIFIPAGYYHHAICDQGSSLHLSFGLVEMIGMDVLSLAFEMAIRDEFFRTPLNAILKQKDPIDFYTRKWAKRIKDLSGDKAFREQVQKNLNEFRFENETLSLDDLKKI